MTSIPTPTPPTSQAPSLLNSLEQQTLEIERLEGLRTFDVTVVHPSSGRMTVQRIVAHFHTVDEESNLSFIQINTDLSRGIRHMFRADRWLQLDEVGTSAAHSSKLIAQ